MRCSATAAMLVLALLPAAARADAPWSVPQSVGPKADYVYPGALAFRPDGSGTVSWLLGGNGGETPTRRVATLTAAGSIGPSHLLPLEGTSSPYGRGRALVLHRRVLSRARDQFPPQQLAVSERRPGGSTGPAQSIARDRIGEAELVVGPQGDAVIAWISVHANIRPEFTNRYTLHVASSRAGRRFGAPHTLAGVDGEDADYGGQLDLVRNGRGDVALAFGAGRSVRTFVRRAGGDWGRARVIGPDIGRVELTTATGHDGRVVLAYGGIDGGEETNEPWVIRASTLLPAAANFTHAVTLDPGGPPQQPAGAVRLVVGPDERATVAWSGAIRVRPADPKLDRTTRFPVRVATSTPAGSFVVPYVEVAPNGAAGDLATAPDGTTLLAWSGLSSDGDPDAGRGIGAALRAPRATTFDTPETVAPATEATSLPQGQFDPKGHAVLLWGGRPSARSPEDFGRTAVLRLSSRD